jgi:hypothetical protein
MKKFLLKVIILLACLIPSYAHPVHVSVINITVDGLLLSITMDSFVTDWETAYFHFYGQQIDLKNATEEQKEWFRDYFGTSFQIRLAEDKHALLLDIDEIIYDDHKMNVKMHVDLQEEPTKLSVYNAILTDIFADQTNLLIFQSTDGEKGIKFDYHKRVEELRLK